MKKFAFIMMFLWSIAGCGTSISKYEIERFDGISAFAVTLQPVKKEECKCNGTKKSGDGLGPCMCGSHCMCKGAEVKKVIQVYFFTANYCTFCKKVEKRVLPALQKSGWKIADAGSGQEAHIVIFDTSKDESLLKTYKVIKLPTFIRFVDGKEDKRIEGFIDANTLANFYNGK